MLGRRSFYVRVLLVIGILFATVSPARSQEEPVPIDDPRIKEVLDRVKSAHIHSDPEHSCCKPCVHTEAEKDPDVFKRPCFMRAHGKSRDGFGLVFVGITGRDDSGTKIEIPREHVPASVRSGFADLVGAVVGADYQPPEWNQVISVKTSCPLKNPEQKGVMVPMSGDNRERDCGIPVTEVKEGNAIQAQWTAHGIEMLPFTAYDPAGFHNLLMRIRLRGDDRISINRRPEISADPKYRNWNYFDKNELHEFFRSVLRFPYEKPGDWAIEGHDSVYEGVGVYTGKIYSKARFASRHSDVTSDQKGWEVVQIVVTDSDPQYVCLRFDNIK